MVDPQGTQFGPGRGEHCLEPLAVDLARTIGVLDDLGQIRRGTRGGVHVGRTLLVEVPTVSSIETKQPVAYPIGTVDHHPAGGVDIDPDGVGGVDRGGGQEPHYRGSGHRRDSTYPSTSLITRPCGTSSTGRPVEV